MIRRWPIRALLLTLALAVALPAAGLVGYLIYDGEREASAQAEARVFDIAGGIAQDLSIHLRYREALLARLADRPLVRALDPRNCDPAMREYVALQPELTTLAVRDRQGNAICSYLEKPLGAERVAAFPWFREGLRREAFSVSGAFLGQQTGRWVSVMTHPVRDAAGSPGGLVVLAVDLALLQQRFTGALPEGVIAGVLDRDGRFLMRSMEPEKWVGTQGRLPGVPESFWSEREGFAQVRGVDGIARIYAFTTIEGAGWRVFAGIPEDVVYRPHRARLAWTASLGALALLAAVAAALGVGRAIAGPIRRLEAAAAAVAGGELAARAEEDGAVEIARVAREFNRMLEARRHAEQDQQDLNRRIVAILEGMSDAFVAFDREWRYTYVNGRAAELFGRSAESLIGRNYYAEYPEAAGTPFEQAYRRAMDERVPLVIEDRYAAWDRWFENRIFPTADGIAIFFHEITERKRAEARIGQQLEELRRWYQVTLGREDRVRELKREVNALRARLGETPRYADPPAESADAERSGA